MVKRSTHVHIEAQGVRLHEIGTLLDRTNVLGMFRCLHTVSTFFPHSGSMQAYPDLHTFSLHIHPDL